MLMHNQLITNIRPVSALEVIVVVLLTLATVEALDTVLVGIEGGSKDIFYTFFNNLLAIDHLFYHLTTHYYDITINA